MEKVFKRIFYEKQYKYMVECVDKLQKKYSEIHVDNVLFDILFFDQDILSEYINYKIREYAIYGAETQKYLYNLIEIKKNMQQVINIPQKLDYVDSKCQQLYANDAGKIFLKEMDKGSSFKNYENALQLIENQTYKFRQNLYMFDLYEKMYKDYINKKKERSKTPTVQENRHHFSNYLNKNFDVFKQKLQIKIDENKLEIMKDFFKIIGGSHISRINNQSLLTFNGVPVRDIIKFDCIEEY